MAGDVANGGLGVGATAFLSGLVGPEVVYDFGPWHLARHARLRQHSPRPRNGDRATVFDFGVGGWYHLHLGENSDFSLGGAFALVNVSPPGQQRDGVRVRARHAGPRLHHAERRAARRAWRFVFEFGDAHVPNGVLNKHIALVGQVTGRLRLHVLLPVGRTAAVAGTGGCEEIAHETRIPTRTRRAAPAPSQKIDGAAPS